MKTLPIYLTVLLCLFCTTASAQMLTPKKTLTSGVDGRITAAYDTASRSLAAFRTNDFQTYIKFLHSAVIEDAGGPEQMLQIIEQGKSALDQQTNGYDARVDQPTRLIQGAKALYTVLPQSVTLQLKNKQTLNRNSYLLGVSSDRGRTWHFVDGGTEPTKIRKMLPDFPKNERLPNEKVQ